MNCRLPLSGFGLALLFVVGTAIAQGPRIDRKSAELIERADAALAKAKSISLVQTHTMAMVGADAAEGVEAGNSRTTIQAKRPGLFRTETKGEEAEFTVSTGEKWVRYIKGRNAYQETDVAAYKVEQLFRPQMMQSLLISGRGFTSMWLGSHSFKDLLTGMGATYVGAEKLDAADVHRIDITTPNGKARLFLSTGGVPLPVRLVGTMGMGTTGPKDTPMQIRMELRFTDWKLDPELPATAFTFTPPEGAKKVDSLDAIDVEEIDTGFGGPEPPKGKPFPNGPDVCTSATYKQQVLASYTAFHKRQYETHGHHDPKWDQSMLEFQQLWGRRLLYDNSVRILVDLRERAYYIQSLGCQDAVLIYRLGNLTQYLEGDEEALPLLADAWQKLGESTYPPSCRLAPARRYYQVAKKRKSLSPEELRKLAETWADLFAEATADPSYTNGNQRLFTFANNASWDDLPLAMRQRAVKKMGDLPDAEPWIRSYYTALCHIKLAWKVRGGGYANTVTGDGWKGFAEHMKIAGKELDAAWQLHPEFPEAPSQMVRVAMAGHANGSMRVWFDRAIAAQLDYPSAYTSLRWSYRPRWHGTVEWIYQHGLEAADTGRFDCYAPYHYWASLTDMRQEGESWQEIMQRPRAYETLAKVCEGYLEAGTDEYPPEYWLTVWLIGAWGVGNGEKARELLDRLDFLPNVDACKTANVHPDRLLAESRLLGSPQAEIALQALTLLKSGAHKQAVPLLRQAMLALKEHDPHSYAYLGDLICRVRFADAPEQAGTILDAMIEMRRREAVVQSFIRWMEEGPEQVPEAFQDRVALYLGPISWTFMQEAPTSSKIGNDEIEAGIARVKAMTPADIDGVGDLDPVEAEDQFEAEKTLAILRYHYCWTPEKGSKAWGDSWRFGKNVIAPIVKTFGQYGLLVDFLTEHQLPRRYRYGSYPHMCLKTMSHVQEIDNWEQRMAYRVTPEVAALGEIADPESRVAAAWKLYRHRGTPRIGFQIMRLLERKGDELEAAIMEQHLLSYLFGFATYPVRTHDSLFALALELNAVPGYEEWVIGYGGRSSQHYQCTIRLAKADACVRLGDLEGAIQALYDSHANTDRSKDWRYMADGRHRGSSGSLTALIQAIATHPNATPETLMLLEQLFPERLAEAQEQ